MGKVIAAGKNRERPRRRTRMKPEDRREQVLQVAARIFAGKGYRATSVSDVVEAAGIGRGTFYLYFESKKDVFLELIEMYFRQFQGLLDKNNERLTEAVRRRDDVISAWRDNVIEILQYHRDNPDLTSVIYRDALGSDEHFSARMDELSAVARRQLNQGFRLLQENGLMRPCDVDIVTTVVMGSAVNVILEHLVKEKNPDLERLADEFMGYHIRALVGDGIGSGAVPGRGKRAAGRGPAD